jgi:hypothetical protein
MFGSDILEVAIGTIFIYVVVSMLCSAIREGIESWLKTRAAYLEWGIRELLHDTEATGIARSIYNHPLVYGLFSGEYTPKQSTTGSSSAPVPMLAKGDNLPSYIPARNFALALMDIAARCPEAAATSSNASGPVISLENIRANAAKIQNEAVERVLLAAIDSAQGDINKAQQNLEYWYNSGMDRVSGWYKRTTQWIIFVTGLVVAIALNVNTITVTDYLYRNGTARAAVVARAQNATTDPSFLMRNYEEVNKQLDSISLPIGWTAGWGAPRRGNEPGATGIWNNGIAPILGWLFTALAATMGAPFWFDILNKFIVIRSTVKPREKSPEEASEDRQASGGSSQAKKTAAGFAPAVPSPGTASLPRMSFSSKEQRQTQSCRINATRSFFS